MSPNDRFELKIIANGFPLQAFFVFLQAQDRHAHAFRAFANNRRKGNPVKIRSSTRCCIFHYTWCTEKRH